MTHATSSAPQPELTAIFADLQAHFLQVIVPLWQGPGWNADLALPYEAAASKSKAYYEKIASEANVLRILGKLSPKRMRFTGKENFDDVKISAKDEVVR